MGLLPEFAPIGRIERLPHFIQLDWVRVPGRIIDCYWHLISGWACTVYALLSSKQLFDLVNSKAIRVNEQFLIHTSNPSGRIDAPLCFACWNLHDLPRSFILC